MFFFPLAPDTNVFPPSRAALDRGTGFFSLSPLLSMLGGFRIAGLQARDTERLSGQMLGRTEPARISGIYLFFYVSYARSGSSYAD